MARRDRAAADPHAPDHVSAAEARALLLHGLGLAERTDRRVTARSLLATVEDLGFVQVDSINVLARAHDHILHTRLDHYEPRWLPRLLERERTLFEHWTHDASVIPVRWFAHWKPRFARWQPNRWWHRRMGSDAEAILAHVRDRVETEGPLRARDFAHERAEGETGAWWGWKPHKVALETLWRRGELLVAARMRFEKHYDLAERVLPEHHALDPPEEADHVDWACATALDRLGTATPTELAAFWNAIGLADARRWCDDAVRTGRARPVTIGAEDADAAPRPGVARPDWKQIARRTPDRLHGTIRLLSPFDPLVRDRKRIARLFGFDYRFEAFTPAPKRRYGYYVLPMLEADRLVGRLDPKFDRDAGVLRVRGPWWESGVRPDRVRRARLDAALDRLAAFVGAEAWEFA